VPGLRELRAWVLKPWGDDYLRVEPSAVAYDVIWSDGAVSRCQEISGKHHGLLPRSTTDLTQVARVLVGSTPPELVRLHVDGIIKVLRSAFRKRQQSAAGEGEAAIYSGLEERITALVSELPQLGAPLAQSLANIPDERGAHAPVWVAIVVQLLWVSSQGKFDMATWRPHLREDAILMLPKLPPKELEELLPGIVSVWRDTTLGGNRDGLAFLLLVLPVAADRLPAQGIIGPFGDGSTETLPDQLLDALEAAGGPEAGDLAPLRGDLAEVITQVYFSLRMISAESLLVLLMQSLVPARVGSQDIVPGAVQSFRRRFGDIGEVWRRIEAQQGRDLARKIVEFVPWGLRQDDLVHITTKALELLRSMPPPMMQATKMGQLLAGDRGSALLAAFNARLQAPFPPDTPAPALQRAMLLAFLSLASGGTPSSPVAARLPWLNFLFGPYITPLLGCPWEEREIIGVLSWLHGAAKFFEASDEEKEAAAGLLAGTMTALVTASEEVSVACGVRCLEAIVAGLGDVNASHIFKAGLTAHLSTLITMLRAPDVQTRDKAAQVVMELMGLQERERAIFLAAYGAPRLAAAITDGSGAEKGGPEADDLFLHDAFSGGAGGRDSADAAAEGVEGQHLTAVRTSLLRFVQTTSAESLDSALGVQAESDAWSEQGRGEGIILTKTTRDNLTKVMELSKSGAPILLEGDTGVGKSATIMAAAALSGNGVVRFNMSRTVTIDELLGQVVLGPDNSFKFNPQPFTKAFESGKWLLLDEINLAQDNVLQCIEEALDTQTLCIKDSSNASGSLRVFKMHPSFRLFATQNPNSGFFKVNAVFPVTGHIAGLLTSYVCSDAVTGQARGALAVVPRALRAAGVR
jgi:hypothetical protein